MAKYILVYKMNTADDWASRPEPEVKQIMQAWGEWVGSMGTARKGGGAFKFGGKSVSKNGPKDADNLMTGYAVIEAKDFDAALGVAAKAPNVQSGAGTIEVYEAFGIE